GRFLLRRRLVLRGERQRKPSHAEQSEGQHEDGDDHFDDRDALAGAGRANPASARHNEQLRGMICPATVRHTESRLDALPMMRKIAVEASRGDVKPRMSYVMTESDADSDTL